VAFAKQPANLCAKRQSFGFRQGSIASSILPSVGMVWAKQ
jgi:hypothetical protein